MSNNTSTALSPQSTDNNLDGGREFGSNESLQMTPVKNFETSIENDTADLTPEETLEVDNWLLSQGIDSGNNYVEKMSESMKSPEVSLNTSEIDTPEKEELISPQVINFMEQQDPEVILDTLSNMSDEEIDRTINIIETGQINELQNIIGDKIAPLTQPQPKTVWESDPSLPNFVEIDQERRAELVLILKEHRESKKENVQNVTETNILKTEIQKKPESHEKQKVAGIVAYDIQPATLLRDVKIILLKDPISEEWMLPKTSINPDENEKNETETQIKNVFQVDVEVEEELIRKKETLIKTSKSEVTSEEVQFTAEADSSQELKRKDMKWVTLADIQAKEYGLTIEDLDTIALATKVIKEKMEKAQKES